MTLTEQLKKGELEWGKNYYCRNVKTNETNICFLYGSTWYSADSDGEGDIDWQGSLEVLAPVPSYEEWKAAYECQLMESELVLTLKKLLKECRDFVELVNIIDGGKPELLTKIDNAIGEK